VVVAIVGAGVLGGVAESVLAVSLGVEVGADLCDVDVAVESGGEVVEASVSPSDS
jgi:hypothetical protein